MTEVVDQKRGSVSSQLLRQCEGYTLVVTLKASGLLLAVLYLNPAYLTVEGL